MSVQEITADLYARLRLRYNRPQAGLILLEGVGDGAGFGNRGWSDAIAMSTWPSKGLILYGFEIKASRQDWLRELDNPEKNAEWQRCCHEWYVVAPKDIVKLEELPEEWGLLIPRGKTSLRIASRSVTKADDVTLDLVAAVFRAALNDRQDARRNLEGRIRKEMREQFQERIDSERAKHLEMADNYDALKRALGNSWDDLDKLKARAESLAACDEDALDRIGRRAEDQARGLVRAAEELHKAARGLRKVNRVRLGD